MAMPAEDAYWQIGGDTTRFWSTAQTAYVLPDDARYLIWLPTSIWRGPIPTGSEEELTATLTNIGIGHMAPIPPPPVRDPLAEIDALKAAIETSAAEIDAIKADVADIAASNAAASALVAEGSP